jgi:glycosyltransferase involved in cell wall biosynthesis
MRILEVNTFASPVGGAEIYMHTLVDELRRRGHAVGVFAGSPDEDVDEGERRIVKRPDWSGRDLVHDAALVEAFERFARAFAPDLVHCHNLHSFPVSFLSAARRLRVPLVLTAHDFGLLCPNSWCVRGDGTVCEGGAGAKCFAGHGCEQNYPYDGRVVLSVKLRAELAKRVFDRVTAPSQYLADRLAAHGFRGALGLPLWVDTTKAASLPQGVERESDLVLFVGRLVREKGVEFLVRAWPLVRAARPTARLLVVGGGPELERLRALAAELGLDAAAVLPGKVPHAEVQGLMARATCQVLPSIWCENSPLTTYESYLAGLPMIASDIAGLPAMVRPGETGLLARPRDPQDLAARILELLGDRALQQRLAAGCRASVARFSRDVHMERLVALFDEVVAAGPRPDGDGAPLPDDDLLAAADAFYKKFGDVERWALDMKGHIDYLENKGEPQPTVRALVRHLRFRVKSWRQRRRG